MGVKEHLDKVGFLGTLFAALCCIGTPAVLAFLGAIGVGFLINDLILLPLLAVSMIVIIWSLFGSYKVHKKPYCIILSVISGVVIFSGIWISKIMVFMGLFGLLASSIWNIFLEKTCHTTCEEG